MFVDFGVAKLVKSFERKRPKVLTTFATDKAGQPKNRRKMFVDFGVAKLVKSFEHKKPKVLTTFATGKAGQPKNLMWTEIWH